MYSLAPSHSLYVCLSLSFSPFRTACIFLNTTRENMAVWQKFYIAVLLFLLVLIWSQRLSIVVRHSLHIYICGVYIYKICHCVYAWSRMMDSIGRLFFSYWCFWRAKYCRNYFSIFFHHFRDIIGSLIDHNSLKFIRYVHIRLEKAINLIFFLPTNKIKKEHS